MMPDTDMDDKMRILVVDDVPGNIKILISFLLPDYNVLAATDGFTALKIAEEKKPDLILLDIMMPDIDGYEVCRRLKANAACKDIPIIFITSKTEDIDESKGFELGAADYITKPITPAVIKARIKTQARLLTLTRSLDDSSRFIHKTFGRHFSGDVVKSLLDSPQELSLGGEKKLVTVMMSELRGVAAICDRLNPEDVISMLNIYLESMTRIVHKYNGTIVEFVGDGIVALFGAPHGGKDDTQRAIACALEMQLSMPEINAKNIEHGFVGLEMGCGINTGTVVAGNIGSKFYSRYGVVGDVVNLAAGIKSQSLGGQVLVSESSVQESAGLFRIAKKLSLSIKGGGESPIQVCQVSGIAAPYDIYLPQNPPSA
ncbi:MAG: response regulator [Magnetococcales bacterium]|nr:response regulator [Magnetococcales bacterium]